MDNTNSSLMIQSNSIRGGYKNQIIDRVMLEVHDAMQTVFGPYATDAWITRNDQPYYTRDGKEVFASMKTDNELAEYARKILYQAVENQARKVGDGTTTLLVLYTNLYKNLRKVISDYSRSDDTSQHSLNNLRSIYNWIIDVLVLQLNLRSCPLSYNQGYLKSMIYTCTQDAELTDALYNNLHEAMMEQAYIIPQASSMETELEVEVYDYPMMKVTRIYDSKPDSTAVIPEAAVFFVNGALDISDVETLLSMGDIRLNNGSGQLCSPAICFLCSGITESTRRVLKILNNYGASELNRFCIFSIDNFRSYEKDEIEDIIAYIYDRPESSGLDNHLTFEAHLYQAFVKQDPVTKQWANETLGKYDTAMENITTLKNTILDIQKLEYHPGDGLRFFREPGPISQARYDELRDQMNHENSPTKRINIKNRLKKLYGKFIEVNVGAKLLKDGQRRFEVVLDAVISSNEAVEHGVLTTNSLYVLLDILTCEIAMMPPTSQLNERRLMKAVYDSVMDTMVDMVQNKYPNMDRKKIEDIITTSIRSANNPEREYEDQNIPKLAFDLTRDSLEAVFDPSIAYDTIKAEHGIIDTTIVEPVSIMTNLLKNSVVVLELAAAKMFNINSYIYNYI